MSSEVTKRKLCVEKNVNLKLIVVLIIVRHHSEFRQSVSLSTFTGQGWILDIHTQDIHTYRGKYTYTPQDIQTYRGEYTYTPQNIQTYRGGYTSEYLKIQVWI